MEFTNLGKTNAKVSRLGLGCMAMSGIYGRTDEKESVATIQMALDEGLNWIDTGDFYGMGHNELLIRDAIRGRRDKAFLAVKFGALRGPDNSWNGFDTRPEALKNALAQTLNKLGVDAIDLYQPARLDPKVPIEETVGAISEMVQKGYVKNIGLSEMAPDTVEKANRVHPIAQLQIEYGLFTRGIEKVILPRMREMGVSITAYGVLSRGLISSSDSKRFDSSSDARSHYPRFQGDNLKKNIKIVQWIEDFAKQNGLSPAQVAFAWVLNQGSDIIPLVGAKNRTQLRDALSALEANISDADWSELERKIESTGISGNRYGEMQMKMLDSERA